MTATTPDILALCAALDAEDDTALGPLADALEEAADPRASGLRKIVQAGGRPEAGGQLWNWPGWLCMKDSRSEVYLAVAGVLFF